MNAVLAELSLKQEEDAPSEGRPTAEAESADKAMSGFTDSETGISSLSDAARSMERVAEQHAKWRTMEGFLTKRGMLPPHLCYYFCSLGCKFVSLFLTVLRSFHQELEESFLCR